MLNATGILLHTNLGRAPLAREALDAIAAAAGGASNLEYDLDAGTRGSRYDRLGALLRAATGAEDALVVNNCAAAVLLVLDTFARAPDGSAREVIVARNELIEIGGGFRLPDVLARSGATLVEVGATNKVRLDDYARALSPRTALLLRAHASNYRIEGFTAEVVGRRSGRAGPAGRRAGGRGPRQRRAQRPAPLRPAARTYRPGCGRRRDRPDRVLGRQAAGRAAGGDHRRPHRAGDAPAREPAAARVAGRRHDARGARRDAAAAPRRRGARAHSVLSHAGDAARRARRARRGTARAARRIDLRAERVEGYAGGGTLPLAALGSVALAWRAPRGGANAAAARLRLGGPPVVARVEDDRVLLDLRTVPAERDGELAAALEAAR